jgi:hypothetical protein
MSEPAAKPAACADCGFFVRVGDAHGTCHCNAPPALPFTASEHPSGWTTWPLVNDTDWCGEFKHAAIAEPAG